MKKYLSLFLCGIMLASSILTGSAQAEKKTIPDVTAAPIMKDPKTVKTNDPSDKALEAAIKAVKAKVTIPKEYSVFNYNFYSASSYADTYWSLTWNNPVNSSRIQVSCDQGNHITYYNSYDSSEKIGGVAAYLKKELKDTADKFIMQIAPEVYPNMEFVSSDYDGIYSGNYIYTYRRAENKVSFPDNTVNVTVDSITGKVRSASLHWLYDSEIPSSEVKLTKEKAEDIINKNLKMKLTYHTNYYRIYNSSKNEYAKKAFLVYEPDPSYISIDAKTGKVYLSRSEWKEKDQPNKYAKSDMTMDRAEAEGTGTAGEVALTEEEIAKLKELEKLITKEKAIKLVTDNKYLFIDKSMMAYSANLNKLYNSNTKKSQYVWFIDLHDARPVDNKKEKDNYRAYASATVDAKTGKILSFYASIKSNYDDSTGKWSTVKIKYDNKYCQSKLEKFLKAEIYSRFNKTKLTEQRDDYIAYYKDKDTPVYGGYSYQYNRYNEGIEYPYNNISCAVDGVTGKIYSYNMNWDSDIDFESPKGAMTAEEAFKIYIKNEGFHLVYEVNEVNTYDPNYQAQGNYYNESNAYTVDEEVRLVYRPDVEPSYISPFTGEQLEYDGEAHKEVKPFTYTDIADTKENRDILLLADMNIGFEGGLFYPDKEITVGELTELADKIIYYNHYNNNSEKKESDSKLITREEVAYDFVKRLGLEKVAKLQGIYNTGYIDQANISTDYLGAVALAKGLGLMNSDASNNFNPKSNVTRADAVKLIMNFIKAQKEGI